MVAEERIRQLERIRKGLLRELVVGVDPENLDVLVLKLLVVDLPGREVLRSRCAKNGNEKLKEDQLLPPELAQADFLPCCARECEVRRLVSDLKCRGPAGCKQQPSQQHTCYHQAASPFFDYIPLSISFLCPDTKQYCAEFGQYLTRLLSLHIPRNSGDSIQQFRADTKQMQNLPPWRGSPEWLCRISRITWCSAVSAG